MAKKGLQLLEACFNQHAKEKDHTRVLTMKELAELLHKEFDEEGSNKAEMEEFYRKLDKDGNGVVTFKEYVNYIMTVNDILGAMRNN